MQTTDQRRASFATFADSTADDWRIIEQYFPETQSLATANLIVQLRMLGRDHGGFPVSRLEHSLQTATLAEQAGESDEYVLCALLHDVGDTLSPGRFHPDVAAAIVAPVVSEAHAWMVAKHGVFQGYYFWHHLGLNRDAREAFRDSPHFELTAEFCERYDQRAFDATFASHPLEHYLPLIEQFFGPADAG
jgi:predicted HD phosphohydrolase